MNTRTDTEGVAKDFLGMSDEDFLKEALPSIPSQESNQEDTSLSGSEADTSNQSAATDTTTEGTEDSSKAPAQGTEEGQGTQEGTTEQDGGKKDEEPEPKQGDQADTTKNANEKETTTKAKETQAEGEATPDYKAFYDQIMTPFKANGTTISLKDPQEAIRLMQMGANYTRKMQEIAPARKALLMLQNNGLLDEGKLAFLIDIEKRNPEAIKKLLTDAEIDPMSIDTTTAPAYQEGNHRVSDTDVAFHSALEDLQATETGKETLRIIHTGWDQASKEVLYTDPSVMATIHAQREIGIYDRINAEVTRQKTLGVIGATVPFLQAYKAVGDKMSEAGAFNDLIQGNTSPAQPTAVATRVAAPKPAVVNNDKVSAAAPTKTVGTKAPAAKPNFLAMSDEEFMRMGAPV